MPRAGTSFRTRGTSAFVRRFVLLPLTLLGALTLLAAVWLILDWPILIDRYLVINQPPAPARAIVCIGGGIGSHELPLDAGWQRIYTAVQLHADGFAPVVIFSGGGGSRLSEAEVYAEAAGWLGLPRDAVALDPFTGSTAEHPANLLRVEGLGITRDTPLLVVTSPLHARRTELCFRKTGFTNFRMVTSWVARKAGPEVVRDRRASAVPAYHPNNKRYDHPLNRLRWGVDTVFMALNEWAALAVYKARGQI